MKRLSLCLLMLPALSACSVLSVADAAVSVASTAVSVGATVVGTAVDVTAAGVKAAAGSENTPLPDGQSPVAPH
ncbi:MAG: hypothetical protein ACOYNB_02830 [Aquabacterium sp.]|uniref:hypothetical protein n=1 Tax=Aquabacterium sp. TaxID=1872578 RepID=UPI003BDFDAF2